MNTGIESGPPSVDIVGGWTCESISFFGQSQAEEKTSDLVSRAVDLWYPADADAVVEQQIQVGNEEDPFWCYLWPTARTLAQQVFRQTCAVRPPNTPSLQVLETGCGIGLVGLAALAAGATTVTFQDLRSRSVDLSLHNARINGFGDRAMGETVDWRSPPVQTFDWIMASDVLYHTPAHQPLLTFLEGAIRALPKTTNTLDPESPPLATLEDLSINGSIWIGDPGRREAESFIQIASPRFQIHLFDGSGHPLASPNHGTYQLLVLTPRLRPDPC